MIPAHTMKHHPDIIRSLRRFGNLESNLKRWANRRFFEKKLITDKDIIAEAKEIRERSDSTVKGVFKASKTWLKNFKRYEGIAKEVIFSDAQIYEWSGAFGFLGSTDPHPACRMAADILSRYPGNLDVLHDPNYTPPAVSDLYPKQVDHHVVDLAELSAMISRTPTPEPEPSTVTECVPERIVHSTVDPIAFAAGISRIPTPDPLAESPVAAVYPVLAFATTISRTPSPDLHMMSERHQADPSPGPDAVLVGHPGEE